LINRRTYHQHTANAVEALAYPIGYWAPRPFVADRVKVVRDATRAAKRAQLPRFLTFTYARCLIASEGA
jgi:hypothetical protein